MLVDKTNSMSHTVLRNHVVERLVAAPPNHLGQILAVRPQPPYQHITRDMWLGENLVLSKETLQTLNEVIETVVRLIGLIRLVGLVGLVGLGNHFPPGV